ncbi:unnamed protein product [Cuscuta campestris]|uniref:Uncharacterized protein n=1 Tax=Cuscuta campestris TaxID=132261 RepID=A0A484L587_9ASTE|nr:unnamed protein product [Cuscuta campestris]
MTSPNDMASPNTHQDIPSRDRPGREPGLGVLVRTRKHQLRNMSWAHRVARHGRPRVKVSLMFPSFTINMLVTLSWRN